ncbi:hypothetical protein KVR01_010720 [Diaporthe batatas]|uniref:uncharacterized protein n=1 Tax=Diaporthe batatas TaxID=748121 RepID=UPI001D0418B2|nr:uncharacterized protein KVR01_010720 [Diaporthe batatas]KAG8160083.1 hypothetical protein KVR01_010720 [Diaporthe batatas]
MGQAQSRHERPGGFWRRRKPQAATTPTSGQRLPPPRQADQKSMRLEKYYSARSSISPTTSNTTTGSHAPSPRMLGDTMADTGGSKADNDKPDKMEVDKTERQASSPCDQSMTDLPDEPSKPSKPSKPNKTEVPVKPDVLDASGQPDDPARAFAPPTRPALERQNTPPHRIKIWTPDAWQRERCFSSMYDNITKTLNQVRQQQVFLNDRRQRPADLKLQLDVYKACDSCTLSVENLIGQFSSPFFHHRGPHNIMAMIAVVNAHINKIDDFRGKQMRMANFGYNLERAVKQTEAHIRQLAELARLIKEAYVAAKAAKEAAAANTAKEAESELGGKANGSGNHS